MIHIVAERTPGDRHDWALIRNGQYKCTQCGYIVPAGTSDNLIMSSGCPQSEVKLKC
jgi:hypothetical protein